MILQQQSLVATHSFASVLCIYAWYWHLQDIASSKEQMATVMICQHAESNLGHGAIAFCTLKKHQLLAMSFKLNLPFRRQYKA